MPPGCQTCHVFIPVVSPGSAADLFIFIFLKKMLLCSVLSVHLTSSKSLVGIAGVVSEIQKEKKVSGLLMASIISSLFVYL